jgi:hypothetical protein
MEIYGMRDGLLKTLAIIAYRNPFALNGSGFHRAILLRSISREMASSLLTHIHPRGGFYLTPLGLQKQLKVGLWLTD